MSNYEIDPCFRRNRRESHTRARSRHFMPVGNDARVSSSNPELRIESWSTTALATVALLQQVLRRPDPALIERAQEQRIDMLHEIAEASVLHESILPRSHAARQR